MEQLGVVKYIENNKIAVEFVRESSCGTSCATCSAKCSESKLEIIKLNNTIDAKVGDIIVLKTNFKNLISYILLIYGLPLIFMIIGFVVSYTVLPNSFEKKEICTFLGGILMLFISYIIIKCIDNKNREEVNNSIYIEKYNGDI